MSLFASPALDFPRSGVFYPYMFEPLEESSLLEVILEVAGTRTESGRGVGEEKKSKGRSPVPSRTTAIESHTDKFLFLISTLLLIFPMGVGV